MDICSAKAKKKWFQAFSYKRKGNNKYTLAKVHIETSQCDGDYRELWIKPGTRATARAVLNTIKSTTEKFNGRGSDIDHRWLEAVTEEFEKNI